MSVAHRHAVAVQPAQPGSPCRYRYAVALGSHRHRRDRLTRSPRTWRCSLTPNCTPSVHASRRQRTRSPPNTASARAYGDDDGRQGYQRLLADDAVDVVYVATPHAQHHQMVLAALNAGKHVLCEKAFTINAREAAELVAVARDKNLFLMEAVWSRFLPEHAAGLRDRRVRRTRHRAVGHRGSRLPGTVLPHRPAVGRQGRRRRTPRPDRLPAAVGAGHPGVPAGRQCHGRP